MGVLACGLKADTAGDSGVAVGLRVRARGPGGAHYPDGSSESGIQHGAHPNAYWIRGCLRTHPHVGVISHTATAAPFAPHSGRACAP
jgi:hypothetical protein